MSAAPGDLDPSFDGDGKVTIDFGPGSSVALQADGKLVAVASTPVGSVFGLVRLNPDGSLDTSFDGDGKVTTDFAPGSAAANAVAVQDDGKIVVAGSACPNYFCYVFALARYNLDGSLDTTFGSAGRVTTAFPNGAAFATELTIEPDGHVVAVGSLWSPYGDDFAIARYNVDGSLDATFDGDGRLTADFGGSDAATGVALQADGRIVVAGGGGPTSDFAIARFKSDGSLDPSFSGDGKVLTDFLSYDRAEDVVLQPDGGIVVVGTPGSGSFALARYLQDGSLDPAFDGDGMVLTDFGGDDRGAALVLQPDGKIVAAGFSNSNYDEHFAIARYNSDGSLDTGFGIDGKVTTDFGDPADVGVLCPYDPDRADCSSDRAADVLVQPDGRIAVVGGAGPGTPPPLLAVARYEGRFVNQLPEGSHDGSTDLIGVNEFCYANGWASDPDDRSADVTVRVLADDVVVWQGLADQFRQDLLDAGIGDGTAAFWVSLDDLVSHNVAHEIRAQAEDLQTGEWVDLWGTPRTITCTGLWSYYDGNEGIVAKDACYATGWAYDADTPEGPRVQVRVSVDGKVVAETAADQYREDVRDAGFGDGYSGWWVNLYGRATPNRPHLVSVEMRDTTDKKMWVPFKEAEHELTCLSH